MNSNRMVVFDLDGTLVDSRAALLAAHDFAWSSHNLPRPADSEILTLVGLSLRETMLRLAPDQDPDPLAEAYSIAYKAAAAEKETLFEGVHSLLSGSYRAAVATGKSQYGADRTVARHDLTERFEVVLGANSVPRPKPFPDMLHEIKVRTGCENLLMVGDTRYDLEMARQANVDAIGVSWGHHSIEVLSEWAPVAHSMQELNAAIRHWYETAEG